MHNCYIHCCVSGYRVKDIMYTASNFDFVAQELRKVDLTKPKRIRVTDWKEKRGLSANNQQHQWYGEISKQLGDRTALEVKNFCKDAFGLPILHNSSVHGDKIEFLLAKLEYYKHSHENKLKLVQCLEVTSLFNTAESKEYMEQLIFYWNDLGVPIKFKDK